MATVKTGLTGWECEWSYSTRLDLYTLIRISDGHEVGTVCFLPGFDTWVSDMRAQSMEHYSLETAKDWVEKNS